MMQPRAVCRTLNTKRVATLRGPRASEMLINFPFHLHSRIPLHFRALGLVSPVLHTTNLPYNLSPAAALTRMQLLIASPRANESFAQCKRLSQPLICR